MKWLLWAWADDWTKMRFLTVCVVNPAYSHARVGKPSANSLITSGGPEILTSSTKANKTPPSNQNLQLFPGDSCSQHVEVDRRRRVSLP
jgi:hypothetical protein